MTQFRAGSFEDFSKWLKARAIDADAKASGLARTKTDERFYQGQSFAFREIALMIDRGELVIEPKGATDGKSTT